MAGFDDATAAPVECHGYTLHPLDFNDIGHFERWAKQEFMNRVRDSMITADGMTPEQRSEWITAALDCESRMSFARQNGQNALSSIEGMRLIFWLSVRKEDPKLTLAKVEMPHPDIITDVIQTITDISGFTSAAARVVPAKKNGAGSPTTPETPTPETTSPPISQPPSAT